MSDSHLPPPPSDPPPPAPGGALPPPGTPGLTPPPGFGAPPVGPVPPGAGSPMWAPGGPPATPPARRIPVWAWIVLGLFGLVIVGGVIAAVGKDDGGSTEVVDDTADPDRTDAPDTTEAASGTTPATDGGAATSAPATTQAVITLPATAPATVPATDVPTTDEPSTSGDEVPGAPAGATGTHDSPVPTGQVADIGGGWRLQVLEVVPDGSALVAAENSFNDPPPAGSAFSLVRVALGYFGVDEPTSGFLPTISMIGASGSELDGSCGVTPDEIDLFTDLFAGGVVTGNLCFVTTPADFPAGQLYAQGDWMSFDADPVFLSLDPPPAPGSVTAFAGLAGIQADASSAAARTAPTAIGTPVDLGDGWTFTVTAPARDLTDAITAENSFNEPPPEGSRFVGVDVTFRYDGTEAVSQPFVVTTAAVGSANVGLSTDCGVVPGEVDLFGDLIPGGSSSGTLCFVVPADDLAAGSWVMYAHTAFADAEDFFAVR